MKASYLYWDELPEELEEHPQTIGIYEGGEYLYAVVESSGEHTGILLTSTEEWAGYIATVVCTISKASLDLTGETLHHTLERVKQKLSEIQQLECMTTRELLVAFAAIEPPPKDGSDEEENARAEWTAEAICTLLDERTEKRSHLTSN